MIRIISRSTIRPERLTGDDEEFIRKIDLGPYDVQLLLLDYIQKGLLFHKPTAPPPSSSLVQQLKSAFGQTINVFYPLAGRLISVLNNDDDTKSFFIDCNGAGAEFVHATADGNVAVADILDPVVVPDALVYSFFTMNSVSNHEAAISGLPLLSVQVTELADGVFVACSLNHCAADGTFFWRFFNTWSEIARTGGDAALRQRRVFGRGFLDGIVDLPVRIPVRCFEADAERPSLVGLQQRMFSFSKAKVAELKAKANAEAGTKNEISSLQALLAHLWISILRSRRLPSGEDVMYNVLMGLRKRIGVTQASYLPDEYLGNVMTAVSAKSTAGEVVGGGLGKAALVINRAIGEKTVSEVRGELKRRAESPTVSKPGSLAVHRLFTGSSPRFDVYGCDFGWGRPAAVRSGPGYKSEGKLTVFPGWEEGSIDFEACLSAETHEAMDCDPEFVKTLEV